MNLPDLDWQWVYARVGWGVVLAALLLRFWPRVGSPRTGLALVALAFVAMALPHAASPAYWLGLMFQYPSPMLLGWCGLVLAAAWPTLRLAASPRPRFAPVLAPLALPLAAGGLLLYADSSGWLNLGLYGLGFDPLWGPLTALLAGAWAAWMLRRESLRSAALLVLWCVMVFCLTRLPSGNLFDAFLDPWVWAASVSITLGAVLRRSRAKARALAH